MLALGVARDRVAELTGNSPEIIRTNYKRPLPEKVAASSLSDLSRAVEWRERVSHESGRIARGHLAGPAERILRFLTPTCACRASRSAESAPNGPLRLFWAAFPS